MEFPVVIEEDEDGIFIATVPTLPGCHSSGRTRQDAVANVREAILLALEQGRPVSTFVALEKVRVGE